MAWTATARYDVGVAPGSFALVQDLLNTLSAGKPRKDDLLAELDSARSWLDLALAEWSQAVDRDAPEIDLDEPGREQLLAVRDQLHVLIGGAQPTAELDGSVPVFDSADARLFVDADGLVRVEPSGTGWQRLVSLILIETLDAQRANQWRRLKACRNSRCGVTFFDRSKNNSGAWHDVRVCGNVANVRAHRARVRAEAP
ncbi:MAG: hypothetical protein JWQ81_1404 [Amycolatopsis sp.]|uniref:CGNR zinc finger domain-containing protein n=1 Tax=Amycolatopsis sp. TaxID=37632 RepID=UPI00262672D3|nr:CGNR zinc finger domain-containing protein [Amycolatopsis sp.]MCU1680665.1 hypothetical protein [Amycolatopsis sp.]